MDFEDQETSESLTTEGSADRPNLEELASLEAALRAQRWRDRAIGARLAASTISNEGYIRKDEASARDDIGNAYQRVLQPLGRLALEDGQWQVREAAVDSAAAVFHAVQDVLPTKEVANLVWTILAACVDEQPEVQLKASEWISHQGSSLKLTGAIADLCDKFVEAAASVKMAASTTASSFTKAELIGLDNLPEGEFLLGALTGVICAQLLPGTTPEDVSSEKTDRVPLLLVVATLSLEDAERRESRKLARGLSRLLRSLGEKYRPSILRMFDSAASVNLSALALAQFYRESGLVNEEVFDLLSKLTAITLLKGVAAAFETSPHDGATPCAVLTDEIFPPQSTAVIKLSLNERVAIQHILEMLRVPDELTLTLDVEEKNSKTSEFTQSAALLLAIILSISKERSLDLWGEAEAKTLVDDMILCCALFGKLDQEYSGSAVWTSKELQGLSSSVSRWLADAVNLAGPSSGVERERSSFGGDSRLISSRITSVLPGLKQIIQGSSGVDESGSGRHYSTQGSVSSSIVAAYQMHWLLRKLELPYLGPHCQIVMPCVLTALDHFSPEVKRQAMGACIHLAQNMNSTELRWFKEAVLDAVTRSLIGSGDLWSIAVKMSVAMVSRVEGKNPRSSWFRRMLGEMMDELERHRDDKARRVIWLQEISPAFEAMGLVLVAHFRRLLPLLYYWLHSTDDATCLLTLRILLVVTTYTWPRIAAHVTRLWEEIAQTYRESANRKSSSNIRATAVEFCKLLRLCANSTFEATWVKDVDDESIAGLISYLKNEKQQIPARD